MKIRLSIAIACTFLSGLGVWLGISAILSFISMAIKVLTQEETLTWEKLRDVFSLIYPLAWFLYFKICYYWVRYNYVPYMLICFGTLFGVISIATTAGFGLVFTFPAVLLMFYILFFAFKR